MLAIIISACLVADPGTCKDYRVSVDQDVEPSKCAMWGPAHFAEWAD